MVGHLKKAPKQLLYSPTVYTLLSLFSQMSLSFSFFSSFTVSFFLQIASYVFLGLCVTRLVHSWVLFHLFLPKLWSQILPFCPHPYPFFFLLHAFFHLTQCPLPWQCLVGCWPTTYYLHSALYTPIKEPLAYPSWQIPSPFWVKFNLPCSHLTSFSLKW